VKNLGYTSSPYPLLFTPRGEEGKHNEIEKNSLSLEGGGKALHQVGCRTKALNLI
jgi:hypothetical protein